MALLFSTISGQIVTPSTLQAAPVSAWVEASSANSILTYTGGITIVGRYPIPIQSDGTAVVVIPQLPQAGMLPADAVWRLTIEIGPNLSTTLFSLTADTTWNAIVPTSNVGVTPSAVQAARDAAVAAQTLVHAGREFRLEDYGAAGDGTTDDMGAINTVLGLMQPGDRLRLTQNKVFAHSGIINMTTAGTHIIGGTLKGTDSAHCALYLTADGCTVTETTKQVTWSVRTNTQDSHSFVLRGTNQALRKVVVNGSGGVGIFAFGASDYLIDNPRVYNTGADGIHNTGGSTRGRIRNPLTYLTGDDAIAVVSYQGDAAPVTDVHITDPICTCTGQTNGRGITIVGGEDISVDNYKVIDSAAASVYVNLETSFAIRDIKRIRINRGEIIRPNTLWGTVNHGAILIGNSDATHTVDDIQFNDLLVRDAGTTMGTGAGRVVTLQKPGAGAYTNVFVDELRVRGVLCGNLQSNTSGLTNAIRGVDYGPLATASLPAAANAIAGATYYDTTINAPGYCTGTVWTNYGVVTDPGFTKLASNQTATSNTTVAALTGLNPAVAANAVYRVEGLVIYDGSTTGDLKLSFTVPAGATLEWSGSGLATSATTLAGSFNSAEVSGGSNTQAWGGVAAASKQVVILRGILVTVGNAGTLQLNFAQNASDTTATTVYSNSWLHVTRVA